MQGTPRGDRLHISFFGRRNTGKSSLINAITGQEAAIVSDIPGTTTDPVFKGMEILPLGPVVLIDTPGIDDVGELGRLRIKKTGEILRKTDVALLILGKDLIWGDEEDHLIEEFKKYSIPFIILINQQDLLKDPAKNNWDVPLSIKTSICKRGVEDVPILKTSALTKEGIGNLLTELTRVKKEESQRLHLVDGIVKKGDLAIMVTPIDKGAPKGRIILPQQQVLRDILDHKAMALVVKETELEEALGKLINPPDIVITDSSVFDKVANILTDDMPLTSFSIIYARQKGNLKKFYEAVKEIENLEEGDRILMAEGCTHHRKDDDIGTVQIPSLLMKKTKKEFKFEHISGGFFEEDLTKYKMIIHCGACMLNKREMEYRQEHSDFEGVPMINYGIVLAYLHGILGRALEPFALLQ